MWVNKRFMWHDLDTSFCNRIINWEIAYYLKEKIGEGHHILMEKNEWPEVSNNFIFLPDTSVIENVEKKITYTPIIKEVHENFCYDNNFIKNLSGFNDLKYTFDFGKFNDNGELHTSKFLYTLQTEYQNKIRPLSFIKIKNYLVEEYLKNITKDAIGIHIRRGSGVMFDKDKLEVKSKNIKDAYIDFRNKIYIYNHEGYPYINDDVYFNIIDNFLKINPNQKFYISTDLPYRLISYYIERYGDNVIFKETIIDKVKEFLTLSDDPIDTDNKKLTIYNMVDLFALSFCKFLIKSHNSTWSLFAEVYRRPPSVRSDDKWENIIKIYNSIDCSNKNNQDNIKTKKLI